MTLDNLEESKNCKVSGTLPFPWSYPFPVALRSDTNAVDSTVVFHFPGYFVVTVSFNWINKCSHPARFHAQYVV